MLFNSRPVSLIGIILAAGLVCLGQTQVNLQQQAKNIDFTAMPFTKPAKTGPTLPSTCTVGEVFFSTSAAPGTNLFVCASPNAWFHDTGRIIATTTIGNLPGVCDVGDLYYVTDATFASGGWRLYSCYPANNWNQIGVQADGTGYLTVTCPAPGNCLVGPNTAVVPSLPGPNTWAGANDFSGAAKTALFRIAGSPPAVCDPAVREAYFNTASNNLGVCTSTNTWTDIGPQRSFMLYRNNNVAAVTANGSTQTLDSFVIPAGTLKVGDIVEIEANFTRSGTAGPITFGVSFGDSSIPSCCVSTPASTPSAVYKPTLVVAGSALHVWGGSIVSNGSFAVNPASSAATAPIASPITVSLTQRGVAPDSGSLSSWFLKVTR